MPRGVKIPTALRVAVIRMSEVLSPLEICGLTTVSERQQRRILKEWRQTGDVHKPATDVRKRGRPRLLTADDAFFLQGCVNRTCDIYLDELQDSLEVICGVRASQATIWRTLKRSGYRMKKLSRQALERNVELRAEYTIKMAAAYSAEQLVFVDESAADRRTTYRGYAWAFKGRRAVRKSFFVRGRRYSILPAMSLDGIIALDIVEGSYNTRRFAHFIDGLLDQMNPWPLPNSVIVMDNCRIHKHPAVLQMIVDRGMKYEFLPPYSPDYNPIELAFSAIKATIRRLGVDSRKAMEKRDDTDVYALLCRAVYSISEDNAKGWFIHSGYTM